MAKHRSISTSRDDLSEEPRHELDFERDDDRSARAGDRRSKQDRGSEFTDKRVREAGFTGGETGGREDVTDDDLAPETLLHEDRPDGDDGLGGADTALREVDADAIGAGHGKDEAELALEDDARRQAKVLRRRR